MNVRVMHALVGSFLIAMVSSVAGGCTSRGPAPVRVEVPPLVVHIRGVLSTYARTGELDSGMVSLREQIESLRATDAAKADALVAEFPKLEAARGPAAVKKQAEAMLGKL